MATFKMTLIMKKCLFIDPKSTGLISCTSVHRGHPLLGLAILKRPESGSFQLVINLGKHHKGAWCAIEIEWIIEGMELAHADSLL